MPDLIIAGAAIRTDSDGRFCLNDLHRAAGGEERHSPNRWTRTDGYQSLVVELTPEMAFAPAESIRGGSAPGTYVCKELVYAYAMWISPAFHLKVIRAYDAMMVANSAKPAVDPMQVLSDPAAMRGLLLTYTEKVITLENKVEELAPKADALDRIATHSDGSFCIRDAAKTLQVQEKRLRQFMQEKKWIYCRPMGAGWLAYSDKLQQGLMEHKLTRGEKGDGSEWTSTQARVTAKGMARLAELLIDFRLAA